MKANVNSVIPIHVVPHHLSLSPALHAFLSSKIEKVSRVAPDALLADVVLRRHPGSALGRTFSASARLALPGRDVHAAAEHSDLYTAIVNMIGKLARRSRKRKTRMDHTRVAANFSRRRDSREE